MSFFLKNSTYKNRSFHPDNQPFDIPKEKSSTKKDPEEDANISKPETPTALTDLQNLRHLYTYFTSLKCRECRTPIPLPNLETHVDKWLHTPNHRLQYLSTLQCPKCKRDTCIGCRQKPASIGLVGKIQEGAKKYRIRNCCGNGKLFSIWAFLSLMDEEAERALGGKLDTVSESERTKEENLDNLLRKYIPYLSHLVPISASEGKRNKITLSFFDEHPPVELFALYRCSAFVLNRIEVLMSHTSIKDLIEKSEFYAPIVEFLNSLVDHKMSSLIVDKWDWKGQSPGLKEFSEKEDSEMKSMQYWKQAGDSIATTCKDVFDQMSPFVNLLEKYDHNHPNGKATSSCLDSSIDLCRDLLKLRDKLAEHSPGDLPTIKPLPDDPWEAFCTTNHVAFSSSSLKEHYFAEQLDEKEFSADLGGKVLLELVGLSTGLEGGVFVMVSRKRPDAMKILVVGPEGPLEGGLFTFDIYLPPKWPTEPPRIQCTSTEDLFPKFSKFISLDREVSPLILSPEKTLLGQINTIVSLLSSESISASEKHTLQCQNIQYAMLPFLTKEAFTPTHKINSLSVWREVNSKYWDLHGKRVLERVKEWSIENRDLRSWITIMDDDESDLYNVDLLNMLAHALTSRGIPSSRT
ncbi:hypothetical protein HYFRA_00011385 [Hymenoscyphus fraxineus]|uniref:Uncharacterized protein n=1 Tax=Hymenoscyphus fraxineus TaxID=746836 RepID=A0A9N9L0U2_9HELO|nr:hypothetical protein HYFRA_00011385 [Hymenoscyphus fraxineus]